MTDIDFPFGSQQLSEELLAISQSAIFLFELSLN